MHVAEADVMSNHTFSSMSEKLIFNIVLKNLPFTFYQVKLNDFDNSYAV